MAIADDKTLCNLEYDRVKEMLKRFCSSLLGEEAVDALVPLDDRQAIEEGMAEVDEAIVFLDRQGRFSLYGLEDVAPLLERAQEHIFLDGEKFLLILKTIEATAIVRAVLTAQDDLPVLRRFAERLFEAEALGKKIRGTIDESGTVREDASPALAALTRKRRTLEGRVEKKLRSFVDRHPKLLSEPVITRRAGRLVVPIKSGAVGTMEFVVHGRSATGQTLYAEPVALVTDNNAIAALVGEIEEERLRILRELADAFKEKGPALLRNRAILSHLDSLFARAAYAIEDHCSFPRPSSAIALRNARHPLIDREKVVPISISLGGATRMVVITGPNTGGKTVTLKTIGLLTLMAQSIIPIPASPDSELPLVSKVRSDIGDEQSIAQNLSTFSAHMKKIVSILEEAAPNTMILLDELGAGTDPQEGAGLGLAVIEALLQSEAFVAVSTHLTPLKYFAVRHPAVKTASMEFDVDTLSPTFRVIEGLPGKSNAFIIARSLGLSEDIVARARSFLTQGEIRAEDIIEQLQAERQTLSGHRREAEQELATATRLKGVYEQKLRAFERSKEESLSPRIKELDAFLRRSQEQVERRLAKIKSVAAVEETKATHRELSELRRELREKEEQADISGEASLSVEEIQVGRRVHVRSLNADGRIVQLSPRGKVTVDLEGIRVSTTEQDLAAAKEEERKKEFRPHRPSRPLADRVNLQLNVRGMTASEALREVESYIDRLLLADIRQASILHGKGTGALRDAVQNYLASCSFVASFASAPPREGGDGVTLFDLAGE